MGNLCFTGFEDGKSIALQQLYMGVEMQGGNAFAMLYIFAILYPSEYSLKKWKHQSLI